MSAVTSDYFVTAGTPIVRGRAFGQSENANSERVAIVNETAARTLWPNLDALDKCVLVGDKVKIKFWSHGETKTVSVTLQEVH